MADKKQLVLVVQGTAALAPYWPTILSDYLYIIIRSFCGIETTEATTLDVELALVIFSTHDSYSPCFIQRSSWTKNVNLYLEWLSAIHFSGGGFCDAAIAEGLSEALMMFPSPNGSRTQQNEGLQRHCVLVAASNPYQLPTQVYRAPDKSEMHPESCLFDAKTVAKSFPQACVSLSVICPKPLPQLKIIYNAGKRDPAAAEPTIDTVKNPYYLILISKSFMEARAALSPSEIRNLQSNQIPIKMEVTFVPLVLEPPPTSGSPVNETLMNQQALAMGNILHASVKAEPSTVSGGITSFVPITQTVMLAETAQVVCHNMVTNVDHSLQTSRARQSAKLNYVKVWEGNLSGRRRGQPVFITVLEAYRRKSASESLVEDWPSTLLINRLISQDHMHTNRSTTTADFLVFRALQQHGFLSQLQEKKLCAVINLPSQTLLLCVSDKECRLIGKLLPGQQQPPPSLQQQELVWMAGTDMNEGIGDLTQLMGGHNLSPGLKA